MDVSMYSDAYVGIDEHARRAERAGFSHLWIYDSPLVFGDPYLAAMDALRATSRIRVGPGVTHPGSRPSVTTAQALATLSKIGPGRVVFGAGTGSSARHSLGLRPATLDELTSYVRTVRTMLGGDEATYREGGVERPVRFIHPRGRWIDIREPVETWVSAFGPRGQASAARVADGVMVRWEGPEKLRAVRAAVDEAAIRAGREADGVKIGVIYALYPIENAAELHGEEARAALGPLVVSRLRYLTNTFRTPEDVPEVFRNAYRFYRAYRDKLDERNRHIDNYRGYLTHTPPELERFVDPEAMATVCFTGSEHEVRGELDRMVEASVDHVSLQIAGSPLTWFERMARVLAA